MFFQYVSLDLFVTSGEFAMLLVFLCRVLLRRPQNRGKTNVRKKPVDIKTVHKNQEDHFSSNKQQNSIYFHSAVYSWHYIICDSLMQAHVRSLICLPESSSHYFIMQDTIDILWHFKCCILSVFSSPRKNVSFSNNFYRKFENIELSK